MATQALYRRYRPRRFSEVRGQEHIVRALRNAVVNHREGQAYLFSGPRGTGKTTSARILAKVLNCERPVDGEPCCECDSCVAVERGTSYDVHELDAASNNGVDAIRDLIEKASLGTPGRHKVYILDEVHMLTKAAEAALLKTLEEPPPHVVFVLATTDPQKVSDTIRSRTQHLRFHLLPMDELEAHVRWVAADAGLEVSDAAIMAVLEQGGGSARDTLSALELVASTGGDQLDVVPYGEFVEALIEYDPGRALAAVAHAVQQGHEPRSLTEDVVRYLRDCFLSLMAPELVALPDTRAVVVAEQAGRLGAGRLVKAMERLGEILVEMRHAPAPAPAGRSGPGAAHAPGGVVRHRRVDRPDRQARAGPRRRGCPPGRRGRSHTGRPRHRSRAARCTRPPRRHRPDRPPIARPGARVPGRRVRGDLRLGDGGTDRADRAGGTGGTGARSPICRPAHARGTTRVRPCAAGGTCCVGSVGTRGRATCRSGAVRTRAGPADRPSDTRSTGCTRWCGRRGRGTVGGRDRAGPQAVGASDLLGAAAARPTRRQGGPRGTERRPPGEVRAAPRRCRAGRVHHRRPARQRAGGHRHLGARRRPERPLRDPRDHVGERDDERATGPGGGPAAFAARSGGSATVVALHPDGAPVPESDDDIDLHDLVDAPPDSVVSPIDRLAQAFPGSELMDERH